MTAWLKFTFLTPEKDILLLGAHIASAEACIGDSADSNINCDWSQDNY